MKLAIVGIAAVAGGLVAGIDGLVYAGAIWIVGGVLLRLLVGRPGDLEPLDGGATFAEAYGGKRGIAVGLSVAMGLASVAIGLIPLGFDGDDAWRWLPVALGGLMGGVQLLALLMFGAGSGLQSVTGHVGSPDHPAIFTLHAVDETGVRVNDAPRLELDLTVEPEGRAPYRAQIKQVVALSELGSLHPGDRYHGLVDLDRPDGVSIDWHARIDDRQAAAGGGDVATRLARIDALRRDGLISEDEYATARAEILDDL